MQLLLREEGCGESNYPDWTASTWVVVLVPCGKYPDWTAGTWVVVLVPCGKYPS